MLFYHSEGTSSVPSARTAKNTVESILTVLFPTALMFDVQLINFGRHLISKSQCVCEFQIFLSCASQKFLGNCLYLLTMKRKLLLPIT